MKFNLIKISLILVNVIQYLKCEKFSAISEMEKLAYDEEKIIEEFKNYINEMRSEMEYLEKKLELWKEEHKVVQKDVIKYITNPINAFLMIKRASSDLDETKNRINKIFIKFTSTIHEIRPTREDLEGAVGGLLRLQKMYKLKTEDIANGIIDGQQTIVNINPHDLLTIAKTILFLGNNENYASQYLTEARKNIQENDEVLEHQIHMFENIVNNSNKSISDSELDTFIKNGIYSKEKELITYSRMCRGVDKKSSKESSQLKCRYISNSYFSTIAPFKIEEADHSANLIIFHDVIYDSEIELLKNISNSRFARGTTFEKNINNRKSDQRVAQVAWLHEKENDALAKISKRVEDMTGLTTKTAEELQIQNYGIGGHYQPHWDFKIKGEPPFTLGTGNRIATVLFYLSTVEKGGATVFPFLKVYVPAVKGMAAFWYNLKDNGDDDYYTRHAACPILLGSKWVANKWIHEYGQEFKRPCRPGPFVESKENDHVKEFY